MRKWFTIAALEVLQENEEILSQIVFRWLITVSYNVACRSSSLLDP